MSEKIQIIIKDKNGNYQRRKILQSSLTDYKKTKFGYVKKSPIQIKKLKQKIKKLPKKTIKKISKKAGCRFNYTQFYKGINHDGYVINNDMDIIINEDTNNKELHKNFEYFKAIMTKSFYSLRCPQRMNYVKFHYWVQKSNNMDDLKGSSNTTRICFNLKDLEHDMKRIYQIIISVVETYISLNIYRLEFVNIEFRQIMKEKKLIS